MKFLTFYHLAGTVKMYQPEGGNFLTAHTGPFGLSVPQAPEQKESGLGPLLLERRREAIPGLGGLRWEDTRRRARFLFLGASREPLYLRKEATLCTTSIP